MRVGIRIIIPFVSEFIIKIILLRNNFISKWNSCTSVIDLWNIRDGFDR